MTTALPVPEEDLNWDLCDRLGKSLRVSRLSVQEMADYLGVHRNTVGAYLNGRVEPDTRTLRLWALRTGVPYEWLNPPPLYDGDSVSESKQEAGSPSHRRNRRSGKSDLRIIRPIHAA